MSRISRITNYISVNRRDLISIGTTFLIAILIIGMISELNHYSAQSKSNHQLLELQNQSISQQNEILVQLQKSTKDLKADNAVNLQIIICMLQVPLAQRTTDLANQCRTTVEQTDNGSVASPPASSSSADGTGNQQGAATSQPSASASATATAPTQTQTSQPQTTPVDTCNTRLLGLCLIH